MTFKRNISYKILFYGTTISTVQTLTFYYVMSFKFSKIYANMPQALIV